MALVAGVLAVLWWATYPRAPSPPAGNAEAQAAAALIQSVASEYGFRLSARQEQILAEGIRERYLASRDAVRAAAAEMVSFPYQDPLVAVFPERVRWSANLRTAEGLVCLQ